MKKKGRKTRKPETGTSGKSKSYFIKDSNGRLEEELRRYQKISLDCDDIYISPDNLCYYQTDNIIKIYLSIIGVENVPRSQITINFCIKSLELSIYNLGNKNYHLELPNLSNTVIPNKCRHLIRKDKVVIELAKEVPIFWRSILEMVSKMQWVKAYIVLMEDYTVYLDNAELFIFCDEMWNKVSILEEKSYNCLKPPQKLSEIIPALKNVSSFKTHDEAIHFYRNELKKNPNNDALFMILGLCLYEKMNEEKSAPSKQQQEQAGSIDKSLSPPLTDTNKKKHNEKNVLQQSKKPSAQQHSKDEEFRKSAEAKKISGNIYYKSGRFTLAIEAYQEAINLWPKCPLYYTNCSASYIMIGNYIDALKMAHKSIELDNKFFKGYLRKAKCHVALGNTAQATKALNKAKDIEPTNEEIDAIIKKNERLENHLKQGKIAAMASRYSSASYHYEAVIGIATANSIFLFECAEFLIFCNRFEKAKEIAGKMLQKNVDKEIPYCLLGMCAFYEDESDKAFKYFDKSLECNPNHSKTKTLCRKAKELYSLKESGNDAFGNYKFDDALKFYKMALQVEPRNKSICTKLHYNIAMVKLKEKKLYEAINWLTSAIKLNNEYVKAYLKRAELYKELKKLSEALQDYERVYKIAPTEIHAKLLRQAKLTIKTNGRKDYYQVLGLDATASIDDIKKAYKKLALRHHPDKHEGTANKAKNESLFKEITEAYTVLKDIKLRHKYDHGSFSEEEKDIIDLMKMETFVRLFRNMFDDELNTSESDEGDSWDSYGDEDYSDYDGSDEDYACDC